jgi:hypothetical protein
MRGWLGRASFKAFFELINDLASEERGRDREAERVVFPDSAMFEISNRIARFAIEAVAESTVESA